LRTGLEPLPRSFFAGEPAEVAPRLLGCLLCRRLGGELLAGRIVEVEAYLAKGDLASHQLRGKTAATQSLYGEPGTAYVHRNRQHHLVDVVAGPCDEAGAVLLRALEPLAGIEKMSANRGTSDLRRLARGPGNICKALAISKALDGYDLTLGEELWIEAPAEAAEFTIAAGRRIGISRSAELALRFVIVGSRYLSAPLRVAGAIRRASPHF
jgi:DNA-3-methyladenine glycosylase